MNNDFLPWVEKYRPKQINHIISNNENIKILSSMINNCSLPPVGYCIITTENIETYGFLREIII